MSHIPGNGLTAGFISMIRSEHKELHKAIDGILWNDWDSLGVNSGTFSDEYQDYTSRIFSLKIRGANIETVAEKLYEIETLNMGILGNIDDCRRIAEKIINLE